MNRALTVVDIDSDEEGSVIKQPTKTNSSCGACRSRESKVWWKAPKGLSTNVLCDNCGLSWRKYADLNHLRPVREEVVTAKAKSTEKREGTPLNGPIVKRARARILLYFLPIHVLMRTLTDCGVCQLDASAECSICTAAPVSRVP